MDLARLLATAPATLRHSTERPGERYTLATTSSPPTTRAVRTVAR